MRILLVVPSIVSYRSFLTELTCTLALSGHEVHCVTSQAPWAVGGSEADSTVRFHYVKLARGANPLRHVAASRRLSAIIESTKPDVVHAHFSAAIFATALAHRRGWPPTLGTFHGVRFLAMTGVKAVPFRLLEAWSVTRLDETWVLTDDDRQGLQRAVPGANVKYYSSIGVGCDLARFDPARLSDDRKTALRSQLGLTSDQCVFAFVGRYVEFKGFDILVRAFLRLEQSEENIRLLLIGGFDSLHSTGLSTEEIRFFKENSRVIDIGWTERVEEYLAISDVLVLPSRREGMPVSAMEALSMGVPVITTNSRGCRDVVRDQKDGIVLKDCTAINVAESMRTLAADPAWRQQLARNAIAGRDRFSRLNYVNEQAQIYERIVGQGHR